MVLLRNNKDIFLSFIVIDQLAMFKNFQPPCHYSGDFDRRIQSVANLGFLCVPVIPNPTCLTLHHQCQGSYSCPACIWAILGSKISSRLLRMTVPLLLLDWIYLWVWLAPEVLICSRQVHGHGHGRLVDKIGPSVSFTMGLTVKHTRCLLDRETWPAVVESDSWLRESQTIYALCPIQTPYEEFCFSRGGDLDICS